MGKKKLASLRFDPNRGARTRGGSSAGSSQGRGERRVKARLDPIPPPRLPSPPSASSPSKSSSSRSVSLSRSSSSSPPPSPRASRTVPPQSPPPAQASPPPVQAHSPSSESLPSPSPVVDKRFSSRAITKGRNIDFRFLEREGFEIGNLLKFQGWEYLCSLNIPTYPNLVREFYSKAKVSPRSFTSTVKGVEIVLSAQKLGQLLRAPCEGSEVLPDRELGLRLLFGREDTVHFEEISARHLSIEHRLLHHMVARILLPRTGTFDFVTQRDVAILYHILSKEKFNLPATILRVMQETIHKIKPALPYGMFLTLVFRDFHIPLQGESAVHLKHFDTYNDRSLERMKFRKLPDGSWSKAEEGEASQPAAPRMPRTRPAPPAPAHSRPTFPSSSSVPPASDIPGPSAAPPIPTVRLADDQFEELVRRVSTSVFELLAPLIRESRSASSADPAAPLAPADPSDAPVDAAPSVAPPDPPADI